MARSNLKLSNMIFAFVVPTVVGKSMILYFGGRYSDEPGAGWGYLLAVAIAFTLTMAAGFIWRFRDYKETQSPE